MASIRRQRTNKRTTEHPVSAIAPVVVRSSTHDPDTGALRNLHFALDGRWAVPGTKNPDLGGAHEKYLVSLSREDIETLWRYMMDAELRRVRRSA